MRAAVLLLLAMPACALAQQPSAKPTGADAKTAPPKPGAAPPAAKPASPKPSMTTGKAPPSKPAPPKATPAKPAPKKAAPPAPHPAPAPPPATPAETPPTEPNKGSNTGLPLPRFAALRSDDVNFRSGPGTRYPIEWVYKRRDLPVEIEREFEIWRLVRDPDGNKGWVHGATLTARRTAVVSGAAHVLRQAASDTSAPVADLKPGVILRLRSCEANSQWCQAQIGDYRGFIKRSEVWGVTADEVIQ